MYTIQISGNNQHEISTRLLTPIVPSSFEYKVFSFFLDTHNHSFRHQMRCSNYVMITRNCISVCPPPLDCIDWIALRVIFLTFLCQLLSEGKIFAFLVYLLTLVY